MAKRSVFRDTWKDYLSFSRRERRGILVLLTIILFQIAILIYLKYVPSKEPPQDFSGFEKEVDDFYASLDSAEEDEPSQNNFKPNKEYASAIPVKKIELFTFNPNNLPAEDWQRLGFSAKQVNVIKNYESKGGKFRSKEDVKKMFCITEKDFNRIESYIVIPETKYENQKSEIKKYEKEKILVDIGIADSSELEKLKGIGPSFAKRISTYRDKLGGFVRKEQLHEVWGFTDSLYESLLPNICLNDTSNIRKINLNTADFKEMNNHPYIGYKLSGIICNYRKQHAFKNVDEIKKIPLVNDELFIKLVPYLKAE
jgi:competence protein ComEA